jgi:hypothetical protein
MHFKRLKRKRKIIYNGRNYVFLIIQGSDKMAQRQSRSSQQTQQQYVQQPQQQQVQTYPQARPQVQAKPAVVPKPQPAPKTKKRYLKMAEQGIILTAVIVAIIVILFFFQGYLPEDYGVALDIIKLLAILILVGGLAYIGLTGLREMRTG